ncbi:uncharacterized protein LOC111277593 [Durio zibethinus]|uniref:Uncharacterized protein LOC111277593 n=1 Tax=Durio zibethinus TaxID=66656 RepID=A0A6P5WVQ6_DURZI|nr:uncharacterized protein LOC111277593 [Durio zibethinus]
MHDLICDVASAIASRDYNVFTLKDEDVLKDWPNGETMAKCTMISLRYANISYFPKELKCPQLDLFLLYNENPSVGLPINFFKEALNLKVLDLTDMQFQSLPSSISLLTNLRTLCLDQCILGDIAGVGELKNLEILSLLGSDIEMLPKEIGELIKLRLLDLSERQANQQSNASLAELKLLSHLTTLDVHIPDAKIMPVDLFSEKLERCKIFIGKGWDWVGECEHSRTLKLKLNTSVDELDHGFKMFLKKTEDLYLDDMKGVKIALHELMDEEVFQQLKNLHIQNGSEIEYIISDDGAAYKNEFLQLRSLTLHGLPQLISFCFENKRGSNSCQNELSLFSEKSLRLSSINVERIWHNRFSNISEYGAQNLTSLTIKGCDNLKQLLSSSMARSLTHLKCFEIVECKCLREVIFAGDIEEEDKATISFPQLNSLKIRKLQHLIGFCSENYTIEFPSLKLLEIEQCPQLRGFVSKSTMEKNQHFSPQALFNEKVAFPTLEQLSISWLRNMKMIWHNQLSVNSFCKLETMLVEHCNELFAIFPFDLLTTFQGLQTLQVSGCGSVEHIFELQRLNMKETHVVAAQLRELYVFNLPKLKNVRNEDPQGILTFQNLNVVWVKNCWSLKHVLPASVARVLPQLKDLRVSSYAVEEIVSKTEGWETSVTNFEFDEVSSFMLWNLPNLKYMTEDDQLDSPNQAPLFLVEKVVPKLEEVSLTSDDIAIICDSNVSQGIFHEIKALNLLCYHDESAIFPTTFLERFNNLEKLEVGCSRFNDLFSYERGVGKGTNAPTFLPVRKLTLGGLHYLEHMWMQGSRLDCILPNLEILEVVLCGNMISLGSSSTPFQNLMTLDVQECRAMINLVTSLAVQSLVQLKILRIKNCGSMKEIVGNEGDDEATYDIIFNRLECIELRHLPSLKSFCSGHHTFGFPSLNQVIVSHCPELEIFCKGDLNTPILQRVQVIAGEDEKVHWDGDLNVTIQRLYTKKVDYEGIEWPVLFDSSKAIEIWRDNL